MDKEKQNVRKGNKIIQRLNTVAWLEEKKKKNVYIYTHTYTYIHTYSMYVYIYIYAHTHSIQYIK